MKARNRRSKTTRGWRKLAPKTKAERDALYARCGARAFLDPKNRKFPVMAKSGPCVPDCEGVRAAKSRAAQYKRRSIVKKASSVGRRAVCHWA